MIVSGCNIVISSHDTIISTCVVFVRWRAKNDNSHIEKS